MSVETITSEITCDLGSVHEYIIMESPAYWNLPLDAVPERSKTIATNEAHRFSVQHQNPTLTVFSLGADGQADEVSLLPPLRNTIPYSSPLSINFVYSDWGRGPSIQWVNKSASLLWVLIAEFRWKKANYLLVNKVLKNGCSPQSQVTV